MALTEWLARLRDGQEDADIPPEEDDPDDADLCIDSDDPANS